MNIKNFNAISFKANLDTSNVNSHKKKWTQIADFFEEQTVTLPYDTFNVRGNFTKGLEFSIQDKETGKIYSAIIPKGLSSRITALTNKNIADYIVATFDILKSQQSSGRAFERIVKDMGIKSKDDEFYKQLKNYTREQINFDKTVILKKYPVLQRFLIVHDNWL